MLSLPSAKFAEEFVRSARLYSTALELIESRSDIAYQLLISAVETLSGRAMRGLRPTEAEQVENKRNVYNKAMELGITDEGAREIALEAAKSEAWIRRKFVSFLKDNCGDEIWSSSRMETRNSGRWGASWVTTSLRRVRAGRRHGLSNGS